MMKPEIPAWSTMTPFEAFNAGREYERKDRAYQAWLRETDDFGVMESVEILESAGVYKRPDHLTHVHR